MRELQAIDQWVKSTLVLPDGYSLPPATNEYQTFTRMDLAQKRRTRTAANGLVDALDPDAVNRPVKGSRDPGALNPEDANYEEALARSIFYCIRAGHLDQAANIARQSARPWWAASLLGSQGISLDLVSSISSGRHDGEMWMGNRRRRLWKECCIRAAASVRLVPRETVSVIDELLQSLMSPLERAIYAAIAPTSTTLPALLPFCKTFEDHLWARIIGLVEDKIETELSKVESQSYWESEGCARGAFEPSAVPDEEMDTVLEPDHNSAFEDAEFGRIAKEQLVEIGRIAVSEGYVAVYGRRERVLTNSQRPRFTPSSSSPDAYHHVHRIDFGGSHESLCPQQRAPGPPTILHPSSALLRAHRYPSLS
jgi:nuclear pore complex protein Nup107